MSIRDKRDIVSSIGGLIAPKDAFEERERRQRDRSKVNEAIAAIRENLFPEQQAFFDDPSRFKAAQCSRQCGKTYVAAALLVAHALKRPKSGCIYLTFTRQRAKELMWTDPDGVVELCYNLGIEVKLDNGDLRLEFANGSWIRLVGADDETQVQKLRGSKPSLVLVDEAQSIHARALLALCDEVLPAALMTHQGTLVLTGTPGPIAAGYYYDAVTGKFPGYSVHKWRMEDNRFHPAALDMVRRKEAKTVRAAVMTLIEIERKSRNWSLDNPKFRREFLNEWCVDNSKMLYRYNPGTNSLIDRAQGKGWRHILGVDLGNKDATAFVVLAYKPNKPEIHEVESFKKSGLSNEQIYELITEYRNCYSLQSIVCETATGGATVIQDLRQRGLPIKNAEKADKQGFIELLNCDLIDGHFFVDPDGELAQEWEALEKHPRTGKELPGSVDHCSDACLYAWREAAKRRGNSEDWAKTLYEENNVMSYVDKYSNELEKQIQQEMSQQERNSWWNQEEDKWY